MTYSDYSLTLTQYQNYKKNQSNPECNKCEKLESIWQDLLRRIDNAELKKEAIEKGYTLIDNPDIENDGIAEYKMITVVNGSKELDMFIQEKLYPFVVCLLSEEEEEEQMYY